MSLADTKRLQTYIDNRMRERGIKSRRELARKMGRDETSVSKLISRGSTAPTAEFVRDLAVALRVPLEEVYWALGLTDHPGIEKSLARKELEQIYDNLNEEKRKALLTFAEYLINHEGKSE